MTLLSVTHLVDHETDPLLSEDVSQEKENSTYLDILVARARDAEDLWARMEALNELDLFLEDYDGDRDHAFSRVANFISQFGEYDSDGVISVDSVYRLHYEEYEPPGSRYCVKECLDLDDDEEGYG